MKKHKSVDKNNSIGNEYHTQCVMHNTKFVQKLAFTYRNCTDEILRYTTTTQAYRPNAWLWCPSGVHPSVCLCRGAYTQSDSPECSTDAAISFTLFPTILLFLYPPFCLFFSTNPAVGERCKHNSSLFLQLGLVK